MTPDPHDPPDDAAGGAIDRTISRRFWERRGALADDPRATTLDPEPGWWVRYNVRLYQHWLLRHLALWGSSWGRVVDLGCGNGDWTLVLARRADSVIAVDFSASLLQAAERRLGARGAAAKVSFVHSDAASFEFPADCDLIVLGAVLQYLEDPEVEDVVRRAAAALSARGVLYVRTSTARRQAVIRNCTADYQAIYRAPGWFEERIRSTGLTIEAVTTGTYVLADEPLHRLVGRRLWPTLGRGLAAPLRLLRRAQRMRKDTEVHHWLCRHPDPERHLPAGA